MKKILLITTVALLMISCSQKQTNADIPDDVLPPVTQIDVEQLNENIDLSMDISQLSLSDLYILRHAFAARKGYPFRDAFLRHVYESTTWYTTLMYEFDENGENFRDVADDPEDNYRDSYYKAIKSEAVSYSDEEQAFIDRIMEREEELMKQNFQTAKGYRVNMKNLINAMQLMEMDGLLAERLARNGFAIVPAQHQQLFHIYEQNDYHEFPSFVTTDLLLQLYHLYFDATLREVEEQKFFPLLSQFCEEMQKAFASRHFANDGLDTLAATTWLNTYFTVANALLQAKEPTGNANALHEYRQVMKSENNTSAFLGYEDVPFEYSLFRPRGHYTRTDSLGRYFRAMMWLQTVPFQTDRPFDMFKASLLAQKVYNDKRLTRLYKTLTEPMRWLMGQPDDVSILQMGELIAKMETDDIDPNLLGKKIDEIAEKQTRLRPKHQHTGRNKVRLMPQRYQPDAEVLQEMVDYDSDVTLRGTPRGLDFMAAMGNSVAEKILMEELQEGKQWKDYAPTLKRMKGRMDSINWNENVAVIWMQALSQSTEQTKGQPYFMLTPEWGRKQLNTALASWAELKHDAILYAKQPMGAECGAGGPPEPVVKGYVEPNVRFWKRAAELLESTSTVLSTYGLQTERTKTIGEHIAEEVAFLLKVSEKEVAGQPLSDEEYDQIEYIGAAFENMSLELIRNHDQYLWEWDDVQGPERCVALIADVYTANADNNPEKSILYEGVGMADELYVVVEVDGRLYLMRGGVLSYRELKRPYDEQRMNDEEWQQRLEKEPRLGVPEWMSPIIVPMEKVPEDNEEVFYSSGC